MTENNEERRKTRNTERWLKLYKWLLRIWPYGIKERVESKRENDNTKRKKQRGRQKESGQ